MSIESMKIELSKFSEIIACDIKANNIVSYLFIKLPEDNNRFSELLKQTIDTLERHLETYKYQIDIVFNGEDISVKFILYVDSIYD